MATQTIVGKARIFPSTDAETEIAKTNRQIGARIEVQWDGISWTDETDYFLTAKGNIEMSGPWGEGMAAQADFELDNTTERFLPENTSSPLYAYLKPRVNIRFDIKIASYYFRLFTGYIKAIEPNRKQGIVNFHCFDNTIKVLNAPAPREAAYLNKRGDELIQILAEGAGLASDEYDLEVSEHIILAAFFGERYCWPLMGEIALAERGRIFFDYDGRLKFWNQSHIEKQQTPIFILNRDDWITNLEFSVEEQAIKNKVTIKAKPRISAGLQVVWTNGEYGIEILNQYSDTLVWIPPNSQQNAYVETEDPCTNWIQPIPNTDYTANSEIDGSGVDLTDSIKISIFTPYADACFLQVQNFSSQGAYLTKFNIRANPLRTWDWIKAIRKDEVSIRRYGEQPILLEDNEFIDTEEWADEMAQVELDRWKNAKNLFRAETLGIPQIKVGDVLSVEITDGNYENYLINAIDWEVDEQGFLQTLEFVNPILMPVYQTIEARASLNAVVSQTMTAKGCIVKLATVTAMASIKKEESQMIQAIGRILTS